MSDTTTIQLHDSHVQFSFSFLLFIFYVDTPETSGALFFPQLIPTKSSSNKPSYRIKRTTESSADMRQLCGTECTFRLNGHNSNTSTWYYDVQLNRMYNDVMYTMNESNINQPYRFVVQHM